MPADLDYLWAWFTELMGGVAPNGMAPAMPGWGDVAAWAALTGTEVRPWEARALTALGLLRAGIEAEKVRTRTRAEV